MENNFENLPKIKIGYLISDVFMNVIIEAIINSPDHNKIIKQIHNMNNKPIMKLNKYIDLFLNNNGALSIFFKLQDNYEIKDLFNNDIKNQIELVVRDYDMYKSIDLLKEGDFAVQAVIDMKLE